MCDKCDEINKTIARYRRFKTYPDPGVQNALDDSLAELEAKKLEFHPKK